MVMFSFLCRLTWMYSSMCFPLTLWKLPDYIKCTLLTIDSLIKMHLCYACSALTPWHSPMLFLSVILEHKKNNSSSRMDRVYPCSVFFPLLTGWFILSPKCGILLCGITCVAPHLPCISFISPAMFPAYQLRLCSCFFYSSPSLVFLYLSPPLHLIPSVV